MTTKSGGWILAVALGLGLGALPVQAQRGGGFRGQGGGPHAGGSLEVLLENQDALGLTGDQLSQIQEMKVVLDVDVLPLAEEIKVLRDQIRAGEVERTEGVRQLQALQGEYATASAPLRGRVEEILTVDQHQKLQGIVRQARPGQGRGRTSQGRPGQVRGAAFQGRGGRGGARGQLRGSQGGFGPRQGLQGQGRAPALGFRQMNRRAPPMAGQRAPGRGFRRGGGWIPPVADGNLFQMQ